MFRRHQHVPNDEEDDESSQNSAPPSPRASSSNWLVNILRFLNVSAIGVLSAVCTILFIQLQAVSLQVASEQKQIDELRKTIESSTTDIQTQVERQKDLTIVNIAGTFTLLSAIVTMFHMSSHLKSMNQPSIQKKIMAILWMSPVYGITSFLSLLAPSAEGYLGIVKDFYEAYVIYQFLSFLIAVLGKGKREIVVEKLARHAGHLKHPYKWLGCQKCFSFTTETFTGDVGFAVVETTDDAVIIDRLDELLPEIVATKKEKNMSALFLAVVNIVQLKGTLLLCGPSELSLAKAAFPDCTVNDTHTMMDLGSRVSRKKDFATIYLSYVCNTIPSTAYV